MQSLNEEINECSIFTVAEGVRVGIKILFEITDKNCYAYNVIVKIG